MYIEFGEYAIMSASNIHIHPPYEEKLRPYIKTYYFQLSEGESPQEITYYPNYTTTLNIYKHSALSWDASSRIHQYDPGIPYQMLLVGKIDQARNIKTLGPIEKLSVVFHPLGLNRFFDIPVNDLIQDHFAFFDFYGPLFHELMDKVFEAHSFERKVQYLDQFFLEKLHSYLDPRIECAVQQILSTNEAIRVQQLASDLNLSRKSLLRLFHQHLGCSVEAYQSIVRFRKSLNLYQDQSGKMKLTEVAYVNSYYDQADFNRQVKKHAGESPRKLFSQLHTIEKGLYWKMNS